MAKQKKGPSPDREKPLAEYYQLHTKAIDDLVGANQANSPKVSPEELKKYRTGPKITLSDWVKAVLIKIWFAGMVCYFFYWGIGAYVSDDLDKIVILAVALGMVTELLTNNVFRFMAKPKGANDRWLMFPQKGFITFPLNLLYGGVLTFFVMNTYGVINAAAASLGVQTEGTYLGVGPVLFGVFTAGWDLLFLGAKRLMHSIVEDAKRAVK